jgi:hypothetical protein
MFSCVDTCPDTNMSIVNNKCECDEGYYRYDEICHPCETGCKVCDKNKCFKCNNPTYYL